MRDSAFRNTTSRSSCLKRVLPSDRSRRQIVTLLLPIKAHEYILCDADGVGVSYIIEDDSIVLTKSS